MLNLELENLQKQRIVNPKRVESRVYSHLNNKPRSNVKTKKSGKGSSKAVIHDSSRSEIPLGSSGGAPNGAQISNDTSPPRPSLSGTQKKQIIRAQAAIKICKVWRVYRLKKCLKKLKMKNQRQHILNELLQTEEKYIDFLEMVKDNYIDPLLKSKKRGDIDTFFVTIDQLLGLQRMFLLELNRSLKESEASKKKAATNAEVQGSEKQSPSWLDGDAFQNFDLKFFKFMRFYSTYTIQYEKCSGLIKEIVEKKKDKEFLDMMKKATADPRSQGLQLSQIISKPFQRLFAYQNIFERLIKNSKYEAYDLRHKFEDVYSTIRETLLYVNQTKQEHESGEKLKFIHFLIKNEVEQTTPSFLESMYQNLKPSLASKNPPMAALKEQAQKVPLSMLELYRKFIRQQKLGVFLTFNAIDELNSVFKAPNPLNNASNQETTPLINFPTPSTANQNNTNSPSTVNISNLKIASFLPQSQQKVEFVDIDVFLINDVMLFIQNKELFFFFLLISNFNNDTSLENTIIIDSFPFSCKLKFPNPETRDEWMNDIQKLKKEEKDALEKLHKSSQAAYKSDTKITQEIEKALNILQQDPVQYLENLKKEIRGIIPLLKHIKSLNENIQKHDKLLLKLNMASDKIKVQIQNKMLALTETQGKRKEAIQAREPMVSGQEQTVRNAFNSVKQCLATVDKFPPFFRPQITSGIQFDNFFTAFGHVKDALDFFAKEFTFSTNGKELDPSNTNNTASTTNNDKTASLSVVQSISASVASSIVSSTGSPASVPGFASSVQTFSSVCSSMAFTKNMDEKILNLQNEDFEEKDRLYHKLIDGEILDEWRAKGMQTKEVLDEIEYIIKEFDLTEDIFFTLYQYHVYYSNNEKKTQIIQELLAENSNISKMHAENQAKISNLNDQLKILTENTISSTIEEKIKLTKLNLVEELEDIPLLSPSRKNFRTLHTPATSLHSKNNSLFSSSFQNFNPSEPQTPVSSVNPLQNKLTPDEAFKKLMTDKAEAFKKPGGHLSLKRENSNSVSSPIPSIEMPNPNPSSSSIAAAQDLATPTNASMMDPSVSRKRSFFFLIPKGGRKRSASISSNPARNESVSHPKDNSHTKAVKNGKRDISTSEKDQDIETLKKQLAERDAVIFELRKSLSQSTTTITTMIQTNTSNVASRITSQTDQQLKETAKKYEELYGKSKNRNSELKTEVSRLTMENLELKSKLVSKDEQIMQLEVESTNNFVSNLKIALSNRKDQKTVVTKSIDSKTPAITTKQEQKSTTNSPAASVTTNSPAASISMNSPAASITMNSSAASFAMNSPAASITTNSPTTNPTAASMKSTTSSRNTIHVNATGTPNQQEKIQRHTGPSIAETTPVNLTPIPSSTSPSTTLKEALKQEQPKIAPIEPKTTPKKVETQQPQLLHKIQTTRPTQSVILGSESISVPKEKKAPKEEKTSKEEPKAPKEEKTSKEEPKTVVKKSTLSTAKAFTTPKKTAKDDEEEFML